MFKSRLLIYICRSFVLQGAGQASCMLRTSIHGALWRRRRKYDGSHDQNGIPRSVLLDLQIQTIMSSARRPETRGFPHTGANPSVYCSRQYLPHREWSHRKCQSNHRACAERLSNNNAVVHFDIVLDVAGSRFLTDAAEMMIDTSTNVKTCLCVYFVNMLYIILNLSTWVAWNLRVVI